MASTGRGRAADFVFSAGQIVWLAIAATAFAWIGSYVGSQPPRDFYLPAIEGLSFRLLLTLGFATVVTRLGSRRDVTPLAVVLFSLASVERVVIAILDLLEIRFPILSEAGFVTATSLAIWGWLLAVTFAAIRLTSALHPVRGALAAIAYLAVLWNVLTVLPPEPFYATDTWSQGLVEPAAIDAERVMYDQRDRVEAALDSIAPQRPEIAELYFVGFAGDATQGVFRREVEWVRDLFERSFDTRDRAISLINSDITLDDQPLASSTNLAAILAGIGQKMDRDRDVLFLFLTSHGSPAEDVVEPSAVELAVAFPPIPLRSIAPIALRGMLDTAGIRWRVIVISACFSGGFIETLENDETLVMTASAADRESFGCSHEADFTYFGRALFAEELGRTHSFEAAFAAARLRIEAWEHSEGKEPSEPQIAMGERIRPVLSEIERRLETAHPSSD